MVQPSGIVLIGAAGIVRDPAVLRVGAPPIEQTRVGMWCPRVGLLVLLGIVTIEMPADMSKDTNVLIADLSVGL